MPRHVAVIMDGNGRWAKKRFLPRVAGHVKGVELVRKHGRPDENRHSLQIEINRRLYMDEIALTKNDRYDETAAVIADMTAAIATFVRSNAAV